MVDSLAVEIFGEESQRIVATHAITTPTDIVAWSDYLTSSVPYEILVLATLILYLAWCGRYYGMRRLGIHLEANLLGADPTLKSSIGVSDLKDSITIWALLSSASILLSVRLLEVFDILTPHNQTLSNIEEIGALRCMAFVAAVFVVSQIWSALIIRIAGAAGHSRVISDSLLQIKNNLYNSVVMWVMPTLLLASLLPGVNPLSVIVTFGAIVVTIIYIIRTFLLFATQKVSIFVWFLYLCAVDLLPITFGWALFTRFEV